MEYNKEYAHIRGFNLHGDWCTTGLTEWINFDPERYRMMLKKGKEKFPGMNAIRIWFSLDAYLADRKRYLEAIAQAVDILTEEGLWFIPTYFNGWFGVPSFGGFVPASLTPQFMPIYKNFIQASVKAIAHSDKILMHDISNEPYNLVFGRRGGEEGYAKVTEFLKEMIFAVREIDDRKITVGTQAYPNRNNPAICDVTLLAPYVDVFSIHPYNETHMPLEDFDKAFKARIDYIEEFKKPYIITECVWGTPTAETRKYFLETELATYNKYGVGYFVHALCTSPVADLHPVDEYGEGKGLYMGFLDKDFEIRPYHDIFNQYA